MLRLMICLCLFAFAKTEANDRIIDIAFPGTFDELVSLGLFDKNLGSDRWLKRKSKVLPTDVQLTGMDIEDVDSENGGTIVPQKETTVCQDWGYCNIMAGMMGKTALYSLGRHNCRMFAELMFKDAPGKIIEE